MASVDRLKAHILSLIRSITFGVHLGIRYLLQLCVNLSRLRKHKRRHNFAVSLSEICEWNEGVEDTRHFLFECPRYLTPGITLAVKVIEILRRKSLNHLYLSISLIIENFVVNNKIYESHQAFLSLRNISLLPPPLFVFDVLFCLFFHTVIVYDILLCIVNFWFTTSSA